MPELQGRFKDSLRVPTKNSAVLMTVISLGSQLQQGPKLGHFVSLVNREFESRNLEKLIIVTTGHLQKHYFSLGLEQTLDGKRLEEKAQALDHEWFEKNKIHLDRLIVPVELLSWRALLRKERAGLAAFGDFVKRIQADYQTNSEFKNLVNEHAAHYVSKKISLYVKNENTTISYDEFLKVSIHYILEECAALVQLFKCGADLLAYPGGMNPPARHVWNHYFKDNDSLRYVRYEIKSAEINASVSKGAYSLFKMTESVLTHYLIDSLQAVKLTKKQQAHLIRGFNQLLSRILADNNEPDPIPSKTRIKRGSV